MLEFIVRNHAVFETRGRPAHREDSKHAFVGHNFLALYNCTYNRFL